MTPIIFTADYLGRPGERVFYIQATDNNGTRTFMLEKQQVQVLAEKLRELLLAIDADDTILAAEPARDPALALSAIEDPEWRVGAMALAFDDATDRVSIVIEEAGDPTENEQEIDPERVATRFVLRRDQARSFVLHALAVVAEGRPTCQLCGLPMDPDGHRCPASNGHRG